MEDALPRDVSHASHLVSTTERRMQLYICDQLQTCDANNCARRIWRCSPKSCVRCKDVTNDRLDNSALHWISPWNLDDFAHHRQLKLNVWSRPDSTAIIYDSEVSTCRVASSKDASRWLPWDLIDFSPEACDAIQFQWECIYVSGDQLALYN